MLVEDDQVALISQLYSDLYTHDQVIAPRQGDKPKRRRRRKNKGEGSACEARKRKLTDEQVKMLEMSFGCEHKLESERKDRLASDLGLDSRQVAVWFQNRRARWKNKKIEEEYSKLRNENESLVVQNCRLETQVLSLKEQLKEAKNEIQTLQERPTISTSSSDYNISSLQSPSSSMTIDYQANNTILDTQLIGHQFGMIGNCFDTTFCGPNTDYVSPVEWMDFYNYVN